jgi:hypothetical protein
LDAVDRAEAALRAKIVPANRESLARSLGRLDVSRKSYEERRAATQGQALSR